MNQIGDWYATTAPENKYQYNGKELNEELGLNWMDYEARYYDPAIGRFGQIDPLADSFPSWASYTYTLNNPTLFVDPDGKAPCPYPCSEVKGRIENLAKPIKEGLEQAGDYVSGLLSDAKNAIKGLFSDQGTPDAKAFHESGEKKENMSGYVQTTNESSLKSSGTANTIEAGNQNDSPIIEVDDLQTNGTGNASGFVKNQVGQPANAINRTIDAYDKAKQANKAYQSQSGQTQKGDTLIHKQTPNGTITIYKPRKKEN